MTPFRCSITPGSSKLLVGPDIRAPFAKSSESVLNQQTKGTLLEISVGRLILARHGETWSNRNGFIMGRSDSHLTPEGVLTAKEVSRLLKTEDVGRIYASTLGRAAFTAALHSEALRVPVYFRDNLAELSCGTWEGLPRASVRGEGRLLRNSWTERPPGGESYEDAVPRVEQLLQEVSAAGIPDPVLLVSHASVSRVYLKVILGLSPEQAIHIRFPHDVAYVVEKDGRVTHRSCNVPPETGLLWETE